MAEDNGNGNGVVKATIAIVSNKVDKVDEKVDALDTRFTILNTALVGEPGVSTGALDDIRKAALAVQADNNKRADALELQWTQFLDEFPGKVNAVVEASRKRHIHDVVGGFNTFWKTVATSIISSTVGGATLTFLALHFHWFVNP